MGQGPLATTLEPELARARVLEHAPITPTRVISSDLPRCAELARGLAAHWDCALQLDADLRELSFGAWEGRSYDALAREDAQRWEAWCADWKTLAPPGGETLAALEARVCRSLARHRPDTRTLLVTHAGVLRALEVIGGGDWEAAMARPRAYLEWARIEVLPNRLG